jgi:hypothetical protein
MSTDVNIPIPGDAAMSDVTANFSTHAANQLLQSGNVAQNNFITVQKVIDYDYLEGKNMVSLTEALGAREVASEKNPGGPSKP